MELADLRERVGECLVSCGGLGWVEGFGGGHFGSGMGGLVRELLGYLLDLH